MTVATAMAATISMLVLLVLTRIISGRKNKNKYLQELRYDDAFCFDRIDWIIAKEGTRLQNPVNPVHPVGKEYVKNFAVLMGSLPLNPCLRKLS